MLITRSGSNVGKKEELNKKIFTIGRDPSNDLILENSEISRLHAKITRSDISYFIEDLNSTNGTFINGKKLIAPEKLSDGDLITLGESNNFEIAIRMEEEIAGKVIMPVEEEEEGYREGFLKKKNDLAGFKSDEIINDAEVETRNPEMAKKEGVQSRPFLSNIAKLSTWKIVILMALGFIILFCIIPLVFIELTNQWCNLFAGFFNAFSPGVCP
jgi:pSer/pThr/pTyr-binding forkhead associated (FHA) protein